MIQIRTPIEDADVRYGIQTYRNEMRIVLKTTPPRRLYGRGNQRHVSPLAVPDEGGIMRAQTDLRRPHPMPYRISFRCVTKEKRMRQAVFNRQPDLFDSTRITSVSLSNETELELMQLLRQLFTELIDSQPVTDKDGGSYREQDFR
jgi:hypothetical protein